MSLEGLRTCTFCSTVFNMTVMNPKCPYCESRKWWRESKKLRAKVAELEAIVEHIATDGAQITVELVEAAKAALDSKREGEDAV